MAFTFTGDLGCEFGGGVSCHNDSNGNPKQSFIGYMIYNRYWFHKDLFGLTLGGGQINNPGRYLVLIPPINGETASSAAINSPYFTFNPGDPFKAWDTSVTFDYMPKPVAHVPLRRRLPACQCALLVWCRRRHAPSWNKQRFPESICLYEWQRVWSNRAGSGQHSLRHKGRSLVPRPAPGRSALRHRSDGQILEACTCIQRDSPG